MDSFLGGMEAVWEVDLWGRVRRMNEAARANFMATQEGRRPVIISLVSGVPGRTGTGILPAPRSLIGQRRRDRHKP